MILLCNWYVKDYLEFQRMLTSRCLCWAISTFTCNFHPFDFPRFFDDLFWSRWSSVPHYDVLSSNYQYTLSFCFAVHIYCISFVKWDTNPQNEIQNLETLFVLCKFGRKRRPHLKKLTYYHRSYVRKDFNDSSTSITGILIYK